MKILRIVFVGILFVAIMPSAKAAPIYAFPIVGCKVTYAHVHHDYPATDILTKAGCKWVVRDSNPNRGYVLTWSTYRCNRS